MNRTLRGLGKFDHAVFHHRPPEVDGHAPLRLRRPRLVGIGDSVHHQSEGQLGNLIVSALAAAEFAGLHIGLTLPRAQIHIPPTALADHPPGDLVVLVLVAVLLQLRAVAVPFEMGAHLIAAVLQIGVIEQIAVALGIRQRADALDLRLDGIHHAHRVDIPDQRRLPVNRRQSALQRLVGRHLIGGFFAAHARDGIGKQSIGAVQFKFYNIWISQAEAPSFAADSTPVYSS